MKCSNFENHGFARFEKKILIFAYFITCLSDFLETLAY